MNYSDVVNVITIGKYDLSDLGDGTAVLTSLSDSKIITLNSLGTAVINKLLEAEKENHEIPISQLAESYANKFSVSEAVIRSDITTFLEGLREQLNYEEQ